MPVLWIFLGSLAAGIVFLFAFKNILESEGLERTNYRGVRLPTGAGIVFVPVFLLTWIVSQVYYIGHRPIWGAQAKPGYLSLGPGMNTMLVLVLGMCLIGLLDDVAGDRGARGFKGHFSEAIRGRFTTGFMKALLGFAVALVALQTQFLVVGGMSFQDYCRWLVSAAVIALTANLFNLLDLAPGRALKVFFPALGLCVGLTMRFEAIGVGAGAGTLLPLSFYVAPAMSVAAVALVLFPGDLREKFMMGDAGANVLGAVVGLGLVLGLGFWWRLGVLLFLVLLTLISEKFSFSRAIEGNRVLNWLDELGRQRREPPGSKI
jgi:UDP-GlcNAc:undecaprenyl-phosphate/decaprenyl-phosphate GlcNAc-1-phosphate transferase